MVSILFFLFLKGDQGVNMGIVCSIKMFKFNSNRHERKGPLYCRCLPYSNFNEWYCILLLRKLTNKLLLNYIQEK